MVFCECGLSSEICSENTTASGQVSSSFTKRTSKVHSYSFFHFILYRKGVSDDYLKEKAKLCGEEEARRRREEREASLAAQKRRYQTSPDGSTSPNLQSGSRRDNSSVKVRQARG